MATHAGAQSGPEHGYSVNPGQRGHSGKLRSIHARLCVSSESSIAHRGGSMRLHRSRCACALPLSWHDLAVWCSRGAALVLLFSHRCACVRHHSVVADSLAALMLEAVRSSSSSARGGGGCRSRPPHAEAMRALAQAVSLHDHSIIRFGQRLRVPHTQISSRGAVLAFKTAQHPNKQTPRLASRWKEDLCVAPDDGVAPGGQFQL
jgi:hypothetical protein